MSYFLKTATRQLTFQIAEAAPVFVDIAQCLSQVNRRLYRQGMVYAVESFVWRPTNTKADMDIISIPSTWIAYNAWVKGKALWDKMNRQGGVRYPKWHDYKIFMNTTMYSAATIAYTGNLLPRDGAGALFSTIGAEWAYSQYVSSVVGGAVPAAEKAVHMLGDDTGAANASLNTDGSVSLIQGYADTRVTVGDHEPALPGDASASWQTDLFDQGETTSDIVEHLEDKNDAPPYGHAVDLEGGDNPIYPGGSETGAGGHQCALITPIDVETVFSQGCEVPCGLLLLSPSSAGHFEIRMAPGRYQGVAAMPMGKVST